MATRKKSSAPKKKPAPKAPPRLGLIGGPSRKQSDAINTPPPQSYRNYSRQSFQLTIAANNNGVIYTCPANKKARIVYYSLMVDDGVAGSVGTNQISFRLNCIGVTGPASISDSINYDEGPPINPGESAIVGAAGVGTAFAVIHVIEEDI